MATQRTKGRSTVYNSIVTPEKLSQVNPKNIELMNDYIQYLVSVDRAKTTILQYTNNLKIFWCWNLEYNDNKFFVHLTKRAFVKFQSHCITEWGWSSCRVRTVRATLSSLSNYIENVLDDEFPGYKPIVNHVDTPPKAPAREKTVFKQSELQRLLNILVEQKQYMRACMLSMAMNNGRRKAELTRFKVEYFDKCNLICNGALYKTPEMIVTKGAGSKGKLLYAYTLATAFQPYLDLWLEERKRLGIRSKWLFPAYSYGKWHNRPIEIASMDNMASSFTEILGKPFYWHSIRHFFTTKLAEANLPEQVIQDMIGWESADMVRRYIDTTAEEKFDLYFDANGIKQTKQTELSEL